jgi:hypothetical protein
VVEVSKVVEADRQAVQSGKLIELHFVEVSAPPPNKRMELTIKSVTPFAFAKAAPLLLAAHARC